MLVPGDSVMPELYITQRNRLGITYTGKRLKIHASPQEIHVWSKSGQLPRIGSINAFECYVEPSLNSYLSVRIGRQALSLDNGRIYSSAPWSQQGRSHEGIRILYTKKINTDLTFAFTRSYGKLFDPAYSPVASHQYKFLIVHHLKQKITRHATITTINTIEQFDNKGRHSKRFTNGGRLEYSRDWMYGTVNAYYQYGRNNSSKKIRAYYIQPEVSATFSKTMVRLGAEILSGTKATSPGDVSNSFVPLYGVAWKFMGNMNLFTKFPADVNDKGLVNPYLFVIHQVNKKLSLRADAHLFYSQHQLTAGSISNGKYLGAESDLSLNFKPVNKLEVIFGFSYACVEKNMELLNKVPDSNRIPVWSYLMISYTPRLLHKRKYKP